jgi:protease-4
MKSFLKYCLATIVGIFISAILFFIISLIIIGSIVSSSEKPFKAQPNSVLQIKLNYMLKDRTIDNSIENIDFSTFSTSKKLGLYDIIQNIKKAKDDENIKGIYLDMGTLFCGYASISEIRSALADFKKSGKFIIAYGNYYSQKDYFLSTVADKIYINPSGIIEFTGLSRQILFYKGTFDKLKIEPEIFRYGEYKSYVEPFINDKMSKENREQTLEYLSDLWQYMINDISDSRNIKVSRLNEIADSLNIFFSPQKALENNLIDGIKYKDEIISELKSLSGISENKKLKLVDISKYSTYIPPKSDKALAKNKIAIIFAQGDINVGEGQDDEIGADRYANAITEAREDTSIKAIVLRVNSPGGTVLGSDIIRREIELTKKVKPVVASMGDVAASGGYYILCQTDTIIANPNTITGSIGVLAVLFNLKGLFNEKLGITSDVVKTNRNSDFVNFLRSMSDYEKQMMLLNVKNEYNRFVNFVSSGRNKSFNEIDAIARGRVWSGQDALQIGLVDLMGGIEKSVEIAAQMAKIEKYRIVQLPKLENPLEKLIKSSVEDIKQGLLHSEFGEYYPYLKELKTIMKYQGVQARIPFILD